MSNSDPGVTVPVPAGAGGVDTATVRCSSARVCEALTGTKCNHVDHGWSTNPSDGELQLVSAVGDLRLRLAAAEQRADTVERDMRERHRPHVAEVYSMHHHEADHDTEDERCSGDCFESMALCRVCGSAFPCLEIRAFDEARDRRCSVVSSGTARREAAMSAQTTQRTVECHECEGSGRCSDMMTCWCLSARCHFCLGRRRLRVASADPRPVQPDTERSET